MISAGVSVRILPVAILKLNPLESSVPWPSQSPSFHSPSYRDQPTKVHWSTESFSWPFSIFLLQWNNWWKLRKNYKHLSVIPQKRFIIVEVTMKNISLALICFSALSFALAVFVAFQDTFLGISAEGFSRGCSNMALICIALLLWRQAFANEWNNLWTGLISQTD